MDGAGVIVFAEVVNYGRWCQREKDEDGEGRG